MKQIVNFKVLKGKFYKEELLPEVSIVNIDNKVWADLPLGIIDPIEDYDKHFLVNGNQGQNIIVNSEQAEVIFNRFKNTKEFVLKQDKNGNLIEDAEGTIKIRLPKDTDVSKLDYINGEVLLREDTPFEEGVE